jgi:transposase
MIFLQDNTKIHKAKKTMEWFGNHGIVLMDFPHYSPDLNPIEQLWFELKQLVNVLDPQLKTLKAGEEELRERPQIDKRPLKMTDI